jgi:PTS system mannose-specific IIA component
MIGKLIVSHGRLAEELLHAARAIAGELEGFRALALDWSEACELSEERIAREIEALDEGDGVLILTAMFGDTPCNAALAHCRPGRVEVVSGVNLPMVVRLACVSPEPTDLAAVVEWIVGKGQSSIRSCSARQTAAASTTGKGVERGQ